MHYQQTKRCYLIKTGLLLLTALCANAHASQHQQGQGTGRQKYPTTFFFATILHTIDTSTCYTWLTDMNKQNARRMQNALMAQLWKIVWLGVVGVTKQQEIFFVYALLSKLIIDLLAQWVCNTKIDSMWAHWPIAGYLVFGYVVREIKSNNLHLPSTKRGLIFLLISILYFVAQQCYQTLRKEIIGDEYQKSHSSYLFDIVLGMVWGFASLRYAEAL